MYCRAPPGVGLLAGCRHNLVAEEISHWVANHRHAVSAKVTGPNLAAELEHPALAGAMPLLSRCTDAVPPRRTTVDRLPSLPGSLLVRGRPSDLTACQDRPRWLPPKFLPTAYRRISVAHGSPAFTAAPGCIGLCDRPSPASVRRSRPRSFPAVG